MPQFSINQPTHVTPDKLITTYWTDKFIYSLFLSEKSQRFVRFVVSGLTGLFVNMGTLFILREFGNFGLTRSAIIAIEIAIINNFFWNDLWTFKDVSSKNSGLKARGKRFFKFHLICLSGLLLNVLIINALYNLAGINEYLANMIAIAVVTFWNFWLNLKISWNLPTYKIGKFEDCK